MFVLCVCVFCVCCMFVCSLWIVGCVYACCMYSSCVCGVLYVCVLYVCVLCVYACCMFVCCVRIHAVCLYVCELCVYCVYASMPLQTMRVWGRRVSSLSPPSIPLRQGLSTPAAQGFRLAVSRKPLRAIVCIPQRLRTALSCALCAQKVLLPTEPSL